VLQEALTNVSRHAHATEVGVTLRLDGGNVVMQIADDGVGALGPQRGPRGTGLQSVRERCALLGGVAAIELSQGAGTRVTATLPLNGNRAGTEAS
jgi:signal transduction histidine kinase